jgi:hypothetical protein
MGERNISEQEVFDLLSLKEWVWVYPSNSDESVDLCFGHVNSRYLLVIINRSSKTVVTVRRMRDKEIKEYKGNMP